MFHGGTSFGFTAGTNYPNLQVCPTSYDYDAPLDESGDPTVKFFAVRQTIGKYLPLPDIPLPVVKPKMSINGIKLKYMSNIFEFTSEYGSKSIQSKDPLSFEVLNQPNGFVLYSTVINFKPTDPVKLSIPGLKDRALVFVDQIYQATLSRETEIFETPLNVLKGQSLQLLVENQGRICFGKDIGELKVSSTVTLDDMT